MRTATTSGPHLLTIQERPKPAVIPGFALIRVEYVTLCGTDLHIWDGEYFNPFPIVQGHEVAGHIAAVSDESFTPGDRVVVSPVRSCGSCHACRIGRSNVCENVSVIGCYEDGALSDYILAPLQSLHLVPAGVPSDLAPLSEPASIALQAVRRADPRSHELALVLGCGPIGLIATLALCDAGVDVIVADTVASRLETARQFGAAEGVLVEPGRPFPGTHDVAGLLGDSGRPITLVIEATGSPSAFEAAIDIAAPTGRVVAVGISDRVATIPMRSIPFKELDVLGSRNSLDLIGDGLRLIERHSGLFAELITHRFSLTQLERAFTVMRTDEATVRKILISLD